MPAGESLAISRQLIGISGGTPVQDGKVIMVFNAKGGCGKTTMPRTWRLHRVHRRTGPASRLTWRSVKCRDQLATAPKASFAGSGGMSGHIDAQGLASVVTKHDSGLDALWRTSPNPVEADRISGELRLGGVAGCPSLLTTTSYRHPPASPSMWLVALDQCDMLVLLPPWISPRSRTSGSP